MKILYIGATATIIYMIKFQKPICTTYDKSQDTFLHWKFAVLPCAIIALITHLIGRGGKIDVLELLWTFSIYLESVAILPQLIVLQRYREVENLTGNYIFFMGAYRALYIVNWIYRAHVEPHYKHHWVVYFCGVLQTLLYADFFYYFFLRYVKSLRWVIIVIECMEWPFRSPLLLFLFTRDCSKAKGGKFSLPTAHSQ